MEETETEYLLKQILRREFDGAIKERAIEVYEISKSLGYDEQSEEMKSDIEFEFNIKL